MIRIEKLLLNNFKGIRDNNIVDLTDQPYTIINGPNGYGKTTIFDAIELCLRGKINRTESNDVTKKNQGHTKAFYQNAANKDVVVKVLLHDSASGIRHTIVKHLPGTSTGRKNTERAFRPDNWDILDTYYATNESDFENLNFEQYERISQERIDAIIYPNNNLKASSLYPLFHYVQQEENIYFLKKDEEEKKQELNFLFQTQDEAKKSEQLAQFSRRLNSIIRNVSETISQLGQVRLDIPNPPYERLFSAKEYAFDSERPFETVDSRQLESRYQALLSDLNEKTSFIHNFSPIEYKKSLLKDNLNTLATSKSLVVGYILQKFFSAEAFDKTTQLHTRITLYNQYLARNERYELPENIKTKLELDPSFIEEYQDLVRRKDTLEKEIGQLGRSISELNEVRNLTFKKFKELPIPKEESKCPLCNAEWQSIKLLEDSIAEKTLALNSNNEIQLGRLGEIKSTLEERVSFVETQIRNFIENPTNQLDPGFYKYLLHCRDFANEIERLSNILSENKIDFLSFILTDYVTANTLESIFNQLNEKINIEISRILIDRDKTQHFHLFDELFSSNDQELQNFSTEKLKLKRDYIDFQFSQARMNSANVLIVNYAHLTSLVEKVSQAKQIIDNTIRSYKVSMVERIKIPFYIYSGKILQHYQQGFGIYIDISETTNRVRFTTSNESDHDIIHHLSSGQLAVVSIAFCLALNKVYRNSNSFNFLAIDDPVQTMDDVNVHAFIELLRHDFNDYQIIMSTHEDDIANYMQYKFEKFKIKSGLFNVQRNFFA